MQRVYLDYNATAPLLPEARAAMLEVMAQVGNPSSVHMEGRHARAIVEKARSDVADLVAADPRQVTFTSGGSEANASVLTPNWSRDGRPQRFDHLVVSAVEHPSVLAGGRFRPEAVKVAAVDGDGVVDLSRLDQLLGNMDGRAVVSVMHANNETGVIQPITDVARLAHRHEALVHSDAVQAVGRIPVDLAASGVDVMTLSAHKLGGPPGCGAVIRAPDAPTFEPLVGGGGQESRLRAGTENVVAIAGFGATARASRFDEARSSNWRALVARLKQEIGPRSTVFGGGSHMRLPQTLCFGVEGALAETLVIALDLEGVAVSSGAACSSGKVGPSHVLAAMGVPGRLAKSAIRVSLGWDSDESSLDLFATAWRNVIRHIALETSSA